MQAADLLLLCCWVGTAKTVVESFLGFNLLQSLIEIVCFLFPSCLGNPSEKRHFKSTLKCFRRAATLFTSWTLRFFEKVSGKIFSLTVLTKFPFRKIDNRAYLFLSFCAGFYTFCNFNWIFSGTFYITAM